MLVSRVLGNTSVDPITREIVDVIFDWHELEKHRIKKTASDGLELGIMVDNLLTEGDILAQTNAKSYVVKVRPTELLKINIHSVLEMGRACFELGNRHLSPKITEDGVSVVYDEPTYEYMKKLGFDVERVKDKFTDFIVCKGHGDHSHSHGHAHSHSHEGSYEY